MRERERGEIKHYFGYFETLYLLSSKIVVLKHIILKTKSHLKNNLVTITCYIRHQVS